MMAPDEAIHPTGRVQHASIGGCSPIVTSVVAAELVLAHQGGWDEMLLVLLPISLFSFLLALANRKAQAQLDERRRAALAGDPPAGGSNEDRDDQAAG
jgi:hypothetical protein